jgi:hypothetical protein
MARHVLKHKVIFIHVLVPLWLRQACLLQVQNMRQLLLQAVHVIVLDISDVLGFSRKLVQTFAAIEKVFLRRNFLSYEFGLLKDCFIAVRAGGPGE